ncbi:MAG: hypothetical protein GF419_09340 [Ignavibacteriales bacterium]|nr:hypothetical protein [Ignavibacteriales bacterium]
MKKALKIAAPILVAALFYGCPYSADVPISDPSLNLPADLIGKWAAPDDETTYYQITRTTDAKAKIEEYSLDENGEDTDGPTVYEAHVSEVEGEKYINIFDPSMDSYYLYKMELTPASLTLYPVTDYIEESFSSSDKLKAFIAKYQHLSFFFGGSSEYEKK